MKKDYICTVIFDDTNKTLKPVIVRTEKGISGYANRMYKKYGDNITVEVGYFDNNFNWIKYCTYHA